MAKIKSMIGCEVSANEIRAVEVTRHDNKYQILAMGHIPLESGTIEEGFIRDAEKFSNAITQLIGIGNFQSTNVCVGVNNENIIMRYATFPKVDTDKLRNMVMLQAQEFIPIPISEMELDFVVAREYVNEENSPEYNIMLIGARGQMLEGYINNFNASRLTINDIDSSLLALTRAIAPYAADQKYLLVNCTEDILNFIVVQGNEIHMVRSITIPEKNRYAVSQLFKDGIDEEDLDIAKIFLTNETSSTLSYFSMQSDTPVEKVFYVSNTKYDNQILPVLQENIMIPIEIPRLYPEYQSEGIVDLNKYAACISIAISGLEG